MRRRTSHPKPRIRVGCSGWNYRDWRGRFYPDDLPASGWFAYYAQHFDTVEINNTFYRLPEEDVFREWRRQAPEDFLYAIKASRYLTHMKKLKDAAGPLDRITTRVRLLEQHCGPILYQLPPRWRYNRERIITFLDLLPRDLTHVLELRDESWYNDGLFELLEERGISYCAHDMQGLPPLKRAIGPIAYARFHGTTGRYTGSYGRERLAPWCDWLGEELDAGREIYAYFNNDYEARAIGDAMLLREMLSA